MRHFWRGFLLFWFWPVAGFAMPVQQFEADGISVWLVENHHIPAVHISIAVRHAGSASDAKVQAGRAQMLALAMQEGAADKDATAWSNFLEQYALSLSVDVNRDAMMIAATALSEHADKAAKALNQMLSAPRFEDNSLERVRQQLAKARRYQKESPHYLAEEAMFNALFSGHPYAQNPYGTEASVARLDASALKAFMQAQITKDRLHVVIAGAMDADDARQWVKSSLGHLPEKAQAGGKPPMLNWPNAAQNIHVERALPQSYWLFMQAGIDRKAPHFYTGYVLNHIIAGNGLNSRLAQAVREEEGLTYGIYTSLQQEDGLIGWGGASSTRNERLARLREATKREIEKIATSGVTDAELKAAIDYILGSFPLRLDSNRSVAGFLSSLWLQRLSPDYIEQRSTLFQAVTRQQVNQLAKEWLRTGQWVEVTVGTGAKE